MLCTSGTTGTPKLVMHTHRGLRHAPGVLDAQVVGLGANDVVLSVSKMSFSYGLGNSLYTPAAAGAAVALLSGPVVPATVHTRLAGSAVTVLYGVPGFWRAFTNDGQARLPSSLRMALSAGEPLDTELLHAIRGRFGTDVLDGYGMSETMQHVTCNRSDDVVPGSCGRVLDGFDIRVVDRSGRDVRDGRRGELWVAGATVTVGYWGRADLTERARAGGWLRTGDLVRVRDGHLFHEGRRDDLMKINGRWIAPAEIEAVVRRHPDVRDVAVVPRSHPSGLTSLWGYVVTDRADDLIGVELTALCRHLSPHKVPRGWQRCSALPRTRTGKLRRLDLRQAGWS
jgi:acyl-coenzyme A synthetase/AMP-(fatty) acid ligase